MSQHRGQTALTQAGNIDSPAAIQENWIPAFAGKTSFLARFSFYVIPAKAGIQEIFVPVPSRSALSSRPKGAVEGYLYASIRKYGDVWDLKNTLHCSLSTSISSVSSCLQIQSSLFLFSLCALLWFQLVRVRCNNGYLTSAKTSWTNCIDSSR